MTSEKTEVEDASKKGMEGVSEGSWRGSTQPDKTVTWDQLRGRQNVSAGGREGGGGGGD